MGPPQLIPARTRMLIWKALFNEGRTKSEIAEELSLGGSLQRYGRSTVYRVIQEFERNFHWEVGRRA
eukprot:761217-Rhodomonas_salina.1